VTRTRTRVLSTAGLTIAIEVAEGLVREDLSSSWKRSRRVGPLSVQLSLRLAWPAPDPGPLNAVHRAGVHGSVGTRFSPHGVVVAEIVGNRPQRVLRLDPRMREGVLECAPEVLAARPCDPLGSLGPILAHHRLAREGAAVLLACVVRTPAGVLVFSSASAEVRTTLARRLERGRPASLLEGGIVVRASDSQPLLEQTLWTRVWVGRPGRPKRVLAWHAAHPAPAVLAEPLRGCRAADALESASALLPGDEAANAGARAALERLVARERTVRLGFPDDDRLLRYAFGASRGGSGGPATRAAAWGS
jgi:hypothetical protein